MSDEARTGAPGSPGAPGEGGTGGKGGAGGEGGAGAVGEPGGAGGAGGVGGAAGPAEGGLHISGSNWLTSHATHRFVLMIELFLMAAILVVGLTLAMLR